MAHVSGVAMIIGAVYWLTTFPASKRGLETPATQGFVLLVALFVVGLLFFIAGSVEASSKRDQS